MSSFIWRWTMFNSKRKITFRLKRLNFNVQNYSMKIENLVTSFHDNPLRASRSFMVNFKTFNVTRKLLPEHNAGMRTSLVHQRVIRPWSFWNSISRLDSFPPKSITKLPEKSIKAEKSFLCVELIRLVFLDEIFCPGRIGIGMQNLIKSRVSLGLVQKVDQLRCRHDSPLGCTDAEMNAKTEWD